MVDFLNLIRHLSPKIAIEWPAHCIYWKFDRVEKFCGKHQLIRVTFDGCMVGIVNKDGESIKKPWAIQTDCDSIVTAFDGLSCDGSHNHVQGRGHDLKETESYSFQMTDIIHRAFIAATSSKPELTTSTALCAVSLSTSSTMHGLLPSLSTSRGRGGRLLRCCGGCWYSTRGTGVHC